VHAVCQPVLLRGSAKLGLKRTPAYENQVRLAIGGRHLLEGLKGVKRTLLRFQSR
jgi:hypothetical protein